LIGLTRSVSIFTAASSSGDDARIQRLLDVGTDAYTRGGEYAGYNYNRVPEAVGQNVLCWSRYDRGIPSHRQIVGDGRH
jgi:hypothetical protein